MPMREVSVTISPNAQFRGDPHRLPKNVCKGYTAERKLVRMIRQNQPAIECYLEQKYRIEPITRIESALHRYRYETYSSSELLTYKLTRLSGQTCIDLLHTLEESGILAVIDKLQQISPGK